jgi:DNA-directed RNA polymerase specialized sigma24 family protein
MKRGSQGSVGLGRFLARLVCKQAEGDGEALQPREERNLNTAESPELKGCKPRTGLATAHQLEGAFASLQPHHAFQITRWTLVRNAHPSSEEGRRALSDLCAAYYEPVVAFLRCRLSNEDDARELAHAFFAEVLAGAAVLGADPSLGKFRSYLLGAVKHFAARRQQSAQRLKRGGKIEWLPLEDEALATPDPSQRSPDLEFDRQWAITVLARGFNRLKTECEQEGNGPFLERAKPLLTGDLAHGAQSSLAAAAEMKTEAFRMAVHRLRKRLRACVKAELAQTLECPSAVQQEIESLFAALSR